MEPIDSTEGKADEISIERCRELLGEEALGLTDDAIDQIIRNAETVARVVVDVFLQTRSTIE